MGVRFQIIITHSSGGRRRNGRKFSLPLRVQQRYSRMKGLDDFQKQKEEEENACVWLILDKCPTV
jgi:hypothetical protein